MFFLPEGTWEVRNTKEKGRGVFTLAEIEPGVVVGDYIGKVMHPADIDEKKDGLYEMYYSDTASLFANPKTPGVHLVNHSCTPNLWFYTYRGHTLFFALRHIFAGEELTVSYILGQKSDCDECVHDCQCGSPLCTGTMHTEEQKHTKWWEFEDKAAKQTKRQRVKFNEMLPVLDTYPSNIPDQSVYDLFGYLNGSSIIAKADDLLPMPDIRAKIRETGRTIEFPKLKKRVLGVSMDRIITEVIE